MNANTQLIYESRESAYLALLTSEVKTGHLYLKRYKNEEGKLDILMAYGVQDCTTGYPDSLDSLKIISGSSPFPVYKIVYHNPDVSELAFGQVFMWVEMRDPSTMDCTVSLVTIENPGGNQGQYTKTIVNFGEQVRHVYSLSQGEFYFVSGSSFRKDENRYTREEIDGTIDRLMKNELRPAIIELQRATFPLSMTYTVSPSIAEKGSTVSVKLGYSVKRKGIDVSDVCTYTLTGKSGEVIEIPETKIIDNVSESSNVLNLKAEYEPEYDVVVNKTIPFVYRTYWGVVPSATLEAALANQRLIDMMIKALKEQGLSALRTKSSFTYSGIALGLEDTVVYAYPVEYGQLSSIKDANGFEYISDYTKHSIKIGEVSYYLYSKITPTVISGFKQTFNF
jgi:hypothetical protein